jgi:hypothetical protein
MKTIIAVSLAAVLLVAGSSVGYYVGLTRAKRQYANSSAGAVVTPTLGKFQIVPGEYIYTSGNSGTTQHGVFRINTETGESELFREFVDDKGILKLFWDKVE